MTSKLLYKAVSLFAVLAMLLATGASPAFVFEKRVLRK